MRIAYLVKTFPRLSETFILNEILGLEKLGVEVDIFSLRHPEESRTHPAVGAVKAPVTYLASRMPGMLGKLAALWPNLLLFFVDPGRYWRAARFYASQRPDTRLKWFLLAGVLARHLRRRRISDLHAHFANVPTSVAEVTAILSGVRYSFTAHAKDIYLTVPEDLRRKIRGAEFVLTCTGFNREYLRSIADSSTPVELVYHGVDLRLFQPEPDAAQPKVPVLVSVGRFCEKKGFPDLIRACAILKRQGRRFRCRIVGYGPLKGSLGALIAELDLQDRVTLEGPMNQIEVVEVYRGATAFVLPCLVTDNGDRDGIPNVLLEAMSMGVPVVSTNVSGIAELIEPGVNGLLVPERDADRVATAIGLLLDEPELRARFAARGRERVLAAFEMETSARAVLRAFQRLRSPENTTLVTTAREVSFS
jgi:glycosyltransferase involved in cell wall biosynthesis